MSSLFNQASLVVEPAVYENGKVYATKPFDGSGDLTFTRASNATRVASNGLIEKVRTNALLQSNSFDTTWITTDSSVTSGQAGYDGTNNAWLLDITSGSSAQRIQQNISASGSLTYSVYLKAGSLNWSRFLAIGTLNASAYFDLQNGAVGTATNCTSKIEAAGNGYYRCSISFDTTVSSVRIYPATNNENIAQSSGNILIQDAQLEVGDIATDYIATTSAAVSVGPVSGLPRLDYTNSTCPRLLLEPQRTNNVTYSEQLNNAAWTLANAGSASAPVVTANYGISPSGYQDAERVQFSRTGTTASDYSLIDRTTISTAAGVVSFYGKSLSGTQSILLYYGGVGQVFTLTTEWQRFSLYNPTTTTDLSIGTRGGTGNYFNGGSLTIDCLLWGFQKEAGAYATSYIPTLGTSVTRVADAASKTGISSLIGQTEGTLFFEGSASDLATFKRVAISSGSFSSSVYLDFRNDGSVVASSWASGGLVLYQPVTPSNPRNRNKYAIAYKSNDWAVYVNGTLAAAQSSGAATFSSTLNTLEFALGGNDPFTGNVNQVLLFKTRLTNAQLAELTTL